MFPVLRKEPTKMNMLDSHDFVYMFCSCPAKITKISSKTIFIGWQVWLPANVFSSVMNIEEAQTDASR